MAWEAHLALIIDLREVIAVILLVGEEGWLLPLHLVCFLADSEGFLICLTLLLRNDSHRLFDLTKLDSQAHHAILQPQT